MNHTILMISVDASWSRTQVTVRHARSRIQASSCREAARAKGESPARPAVWLWRGGGDWEACCAARASGSGLYTKLGSPLGARPMRRCGGSARLTRERRSGEGGRELGGTGEAILPLPWTRISVPALLRASAKGGCRSQCGLRLGLRLGEK